MVEKIYFIENSYDLGMALTKIQDTIPCTLNRECIEMDFSKITINARVEDLAFVENTLAPFI